MTLENILGIFRDFPKEEKYTFLGALFSTCSYFTYWVFVDVPELNVSIVKLTIFFIFFWLLCIGTGWPLIILFEKVLDNLAFKKNLKSEQFVCHNQYNEVACQIHLCVVVSVFWLLSLYPIIKIYGMKLPAFPVCLVYIITSVVLLICLSQACSLYSALAPYSKSIHYDEDTAVKEMAKRIVSGMDLNNKP